VTPRGHLTFFFVISVVPFVGFAVAVVLLWHEAVDGVDLAILAVMYTLCTLGGTMGFHRLLTHRSYDTYRGIRLSLAVLGTTSAQGSPITWVANHRRHHAFSDVDGDPHSPHAGRGEGLLGTLRALWHAHMGWMLDPELRSQTMRYAPDLVRDPGMRRISSLFVPIVLGGLAVPFLAGFAIKGTLAGGLSGMLWGGLVRLFLQQHMTYSVNSVAHFMGRRRFDIPDESRNVAWLAIPSLGDSWHHNHHAFPTSARHGLRWWEVDVAGLVIALFERLGLAWDVVRVDREVQREKEPAAKPPAQPPAGIAARG
jgi:stearoyl-CoA desaturase (delta-9 desaturase)